MHSNLFTECIQDQFLKYCNSKHVGPIVSYKGILTLKTVTILNSNIDGILSLVTHYSEMQQTAENKIIH